MACALKRSEQRQNAVSIEIARIAAKPMWAELMIKSDKRVNYLMASSVQNGPKTMFFKDYSLLVVFNAYLRSKCTIPDIYTCNRAGLVVIRSLRTALGSFKEERKKKKKDEQFAWAAILVYHFRNVCRLRQRHFHAQNNHLINPRCLESRGTLKQRRSATAP